MLNMPSSVEIFLADFPVDMRMSFDSLAGIVREVMGRQPYKGLYVFYNRRRDKIKVLYWNRNGFCLFYKRLEKGRFRIPGYRSVESGYMEMDILELDMLLDGIDISVTERGAALPLF